MDSGGIFFVLEPLFFLSPSLYLDTALMRACHLIKSPIKGKTGERFAEANSVHCKH